jgi:membrane protease YdiL (CAAX protease family)
VSGSPEAAPSATPRWGIREAVIGMVLAFVASVIALGIWGAATGQTTSDEISLAGVAAGQAALWLGYLGAPVWASRRLGAGSLAVDFGFVVRARDALVGLPVGLLAQLGLIPLLYLPFRPLLRGHDLDQPAKDLADKAHGIGFVLLVVVLVVGAPIVEELFFRGLLLRALVRRFGDRWAVAVSAVVFATAHLEALQFLGLVAVGVVFALLALRYGRLGPNIFAHAAFNAVVVAILVANR